jgi:hypothetical protein
VGCKGVGCTTYAAGAVGVEGLCSPSVCTSEEDMAARDLRKGPFPAIEILP